VHLPEIRQAIAFQRLQVDGKVLLEDSSATVTKIAIEPVWWLPGGDEQHPAQADRSGHFLGQAQMAEVNRIEGAAEDTDRFVRGEG